MALSQFLYDNRCDRADCDGLDGIIQYAPGACEEPCLYRPRTYRVLLRVCRAAQPGHHHAVLGVPRGHTRDGSLLASCMSQLPARLPCKPALCSSMCASPCLNSQPNRDPCWLSCTDAHAHARSARCCVSLFRWPRVPCSFHLYRSRRRNRAHLQVRPNRGT